MTTTKPAAKSPRRLRGGLVSRRKAASAAELREMLDALGKLRADADGRITDDPTASISMIDDPGLQVDLYGIRQRLTWIEREERRPSPDPYLWHYHLTRANAFFEAIYGAIERREKALAGQLSGEARKTRTRDKVREARAYCIKMSLARSRWVSVISKRTGLRDHDQIRGHLAALDKEDHEKPG